ncbi:MAG: hypothetical protein IJ379_08370, partial [Lachnospiraceae bacterium]|nr:hypothetical protein [Lachnospiraceae bacterium]
NSYGMSKNVGWQNIVVPYDVYNNYDALKGLFLELTSSKAFTLYIDEITVVDAGTWNSFSDASTASVWKSANTTLTWLESYDGEDGVLKIDKGAASDEQYVGNTNGNNWLPVFDKSRYRNAVGLRFRVKLVSDLPSQNIMVISQGWTAGAQSMLNYGITPNSGWQEIELPFDVFNNFEAFDGLYLYLSANGAFTLYIDEITVVTDNLA